MKGDKTGKKITVKFFLNQAVGPVFGEGRKRYYPLYVQVTYNRRNMQFRSRYSEYYASLEEVKPSLLEFEERVIKSIVSHEAEKEKGGYELKGLKKKYDVYSLSILEVLELYLKPKLRLCILKTGSELANVLNFTDTRSSVNLLYEAAKLLFKGFDSYVPEKLAEELEAYNHYQRLYRPLLTYNFPTLIDWIDGTHKQELAETLNKTYKARADLVKVVQALIDRAVKEKLKDMDE